jgi:hypothetical protein
MFIYNNIIVYLYINKYIYVCMYVCGYMCKHICIFLGINWLSFEVTFAINQQCDG